MGKFEIEFFVRLAETADVYAYRSQDVNQAIHLSFQGIIFVDDGYFFVLNYTIARFEAAFLVPKDIIRFGKKVFQPGLKMFCVLDQ